MKDLTALFVKLCVLQIYFSLNVKAKQIDSYCDDPYIDAIMWSFRENQTENDIIYIFRGQHFWKYNLMTGDLWDEKLIKQVWPDVKLPVTAISRFQADESVGKAVCENIIIVSRLEYWIYDCKEEYESNQTLRLTGIDCAEKYKK
ncbi:hypothetical protein B4U79_18072 [Dinothrombium tinctorium]|uniref:Uncharacterized protein n=1 Tax=Dinothrombium tinctorium TaxID=1965070 RepID=A0A443R5U7_9ACAR|nr:hypothetical protein B4U79_18072 [Dinothrombium tinctorium]